MPTRLHPLESLLGCVAIRSWIWDTVAPTMVQLLVTKAYYVLIAHPQRLTRCSSCGCLHTATPKSSYCVYRALFTFLQRLLAFVSRSHGVSSALLSRPRKLEQWLLYKSNPKFVMDNYVKK